MRNLKTSLKVEKVKETQYGGGNICIDSTGRYLFSILGTTLNVIDVNTGETVHKLESEEEEITSVCISPDDCHVITAHRNLLLKQWDNWRRVDDHGDKSSHRDDEKKIEVTTKCTRTWKALHVAPVLHMCFDDTSTLLATASSDYTIKIWDTKAQYCTHNLKGAQGLIRCVKFYPKIEDKQQLISGCDDGKIRVYNLNTSKMDACLEGHYSAVTCFEYIGSTSGGQVYDRLVSSSRDKVLIIWDLNTLTKVKTIPVYESIESFVLTSQIVGGDSSSSSERHLITMGNEGLLKLWDTKSSKLIYTQNEADSLKILNKRKSSKESEELETVIMQGFYSKAINSLVLLTADELIVFVKIDSDLIKSLLNQPSETMSAPVELGALFQVYKQYVGDHGEILDLQYCNKAQNLIAMATNSEFLKVYDLDTWDCRLLKGHTDLVISVTAFVDNTNENESYLASSSKDSTIRVWRIARDEKKDNDETSGGYKFECVSVCQGHTQDVGALCFSNMAMSFLVSGSIDTTVKLWKISGVATKGGKKKKSTDAVDEFKMSVGFTIKAHEKDINSISVSPNDKLIATGSSDKSAKIWDSTDGACLAILNGHKRGVWAVKFSPIDQLLASSSADGTIRLWSLGEFDCIKTFEGHNTSVLKVHFLNNGTQLISTGSDGLIKLWNIKANDCVGTFDEHDDKAWALCVNNDETRFVSGGADGKLVVWRDITQELYEEELEKREEILLKEQELDNCVQQKRWKKALALAILLDKPFKCYNIIKAILQQPDSEMSKCRSDLEQTLVKMREDQIRSLMKYATNWNTNTKFCHLAQIVFELIFKNFPPQFFLDEASREQVSKTLAEFVPYTERHVNRVNKLMQQVMLIDYIWQNMKLSDETSSVVVGNRHETNQVEMK